jgi:hypothetical protein
MKSRRMRCMGYVALKLESRGAYRVLVGKPGKKRLPGRCEVVIKIDLQEITLG